MKLTQSQIALMVGFCLSRGVQLPANFPSWNGTDLTSFNLGKLLALMSSQADGNRDD